MNTFLMHATSRIEGYTYVRDGKTIRVRPYTRRYIPMGNNIGSTRVNRPIGRQKIETNVSVSNKSFGRPKKVEETANANSMQTHGVYSNDSPQQKYVHVNNESEIKKYSVKELKKMITDISHDRYLFDKQLENSEFKFNKIKSFLNSEPNYTNYTIGDLYTAKEELEYVRGGILALEQAKRNCAKEIVNRMKKMSIFQLAASAIGSLGESVKLITQGKKMVEKVGLNSIKREAMEQSISEGKELERVYRQKAVEEIKTRITDKANTIIDTAKGFLKKLFGGG